MYNATTTSLADAFPLSSMTRSLSSAFKKGTGANSSTSDSVETGSRGGVNGQEVIRYARHRVHQTALCHCSSIHNDFFEIF